MKEEIELAKQILDEMEEAYVNEAIESVGGKATIVKTLMDSIELSGVAYGLANDSEIEPWDPEGEFCELDDEEYEEGDNEDEPPEETEE